MGSNEGLRPGEDRPHVEEVGMIGKAGKRKYCAVLGFGEDFPAFVVLGVFVEMFTEPVSGVEE